MNLYDRLMRDGAFETFNPDFYWVHLTEQERYETWSWFVDVLGEPATYSDFCDAMDARPVS